MKRIKKHIGKDEFQRYLENQMTDAERNTFERELQKHPFEAEALEGFQQISLADMDADLILLSGKIKSGKRKTSTRWWAVAASLLLLISTGIIWFQLNEKLPRQEVAQTKSIQKEIIQIQQLKTKNMELSVPADAKDTGTTFGITKKTTPRKVEKKKAVSPPITVPAKEEVELEKPIQFATVNESIQVENTSNISNLVSAPKPQFMIRGAGPLNEKRKIGTGSTSSQLVVGNTKLIWGKVISLSDSLPLPGVAIVEKGTSNGTVSDRDGNFILKLTNAKDSVLVANFVGMEMKEFYPSRDSTLVVGLEPSALAMDEVVTIGYGVMRETQLSDDSENAQPQSGMNSFKKYLAERTVLPIDNLQDRMVVKVLLQIDMHGKIIYVENTNHAVNSLFEKAKQILMNGPAWNPKKTNGIPEESKVTLRIVFRKEK